MALRIVLIDVLFFFHLSTVQQVEACFVAASLVVALPVDWVVAVPLMVRECEPEVGITFSQIED